jgi:hypothetical protein
MDEEKGYSGIFYVMMALGIIGLVGMLSIAMSAGGGM